MSFLKRSGAAIGGALVAAAIAASPAFAGQVNLRGVVDIKKTNSTISNTLNETIVSTIVSTVNSTHILDKGVTAIGVDASLVDSTTISSTTSSTISSTISDTIAETVSQTIVDGVLFASQPADVSVEISQGTINSSSPYNNEIVDAGSIDNIVSVLNTTGLTQVQAAAGQGNVQVASNTIADGDVLIGLGVGMDQVALKEFAHAVVSPGAGLQNSNISYIEQIVGVAEAAAESSANNNLGNTDTMVDELTGISTTMNANVVTAIAIDQGEVSEFSPHDNTINGTAVPFLNDVIVDGTAGVTQVSAAAGQSNVQTLYNNIVYAGGAFTGPDPF
jgi:hypothetical protein